MPNNGDPHGEAVLTVRYGLIAQAIAGRPLRIRAAAVAVLPYTDGTVIHVSADPKHDRAIEVAVQAMLLAGDSLAPAHMVALVGQPARARRYLALEAARRLAGATSLTKLILGDRLTLPAATTATAAESLAASRRTSEPVAEPLLGQLRPTRLLANSTSLPRGVARDEDMRQPGRTIAEQREELDDDEEADDIPAAIRRMASPLNLPNMMSRLFHQALGTKRAPGQGAPGAEVPTTSIRQSRQPMPHGRRVPYRIAEEAVDETQPAGGMWLYPEWDDQRDVYRPDWCSVHELAHTHIADAGARRDFRPDAWLEAAIRRLTPALRRVGRQLDGEELDLDAIVDDAVSGHVQRLHGGGGETQPRVYQASLHVARDLAVHLMIDISGSVAERDRGGSTIVDEQLHAASALTRAFTLAGNRVAATAFHSHGRGHCRSIILKTFEETLPGPALRGMLSLTPSGYSRLGAGIRHATRRLADDGGSARSLLILLSDGVPYDLDYSGRHGVSDVIAALREAHQRGLRVLWLSFGAMTPELRQALADGPQRLIEADSYERLRMQLPCVIAAMVGRRAAQLKRAA